MKLSHPYQLAMTLVSVIAVVTLAACTASPAAESTSASGTDSGTPSVATTDQATNAASGTVAPGATAAATQIGLTPLPSTAPATPAPAATRPAPVAQLITVQVLQTPGLGSFLADGKGRTFYMFKSDTKSMSNCYGSCAQQWPPVLVAGQPVLFVGVHIDLIGTIKRADGSTQLTYNGWPVYYHATDRGIGDLSGQGAGGAWFVITPEGNAAAAAQ